MTSEVKHIILDHPSSTKEDCSKIGLNIENHCGTCGSKNFTYCVPGLEKHDYILFSDILYVCKCQGCGIISCLRLGSFLNYLKIKGATIIPKEQFLEIRYKDEKLGLTDIPSVEEIISRRKKLNLSQNVQ